MSDANAAPEADEPNHERTGPRIGVKHLFAWIAVTAVLLAIYQRSGLRSRDLPQFLSFLFWPSCYAIVGGAGVTGFSVLCSARTPGSPLIRQPGHWVLLCVTLSVLLVLLVNPLRSSGWVARSMPIQNFVLTVAWTWAAWRSRGAWRFLFGIDALSHLVVFGGVLITATMDGYRASTSLSLITNSLILVWAGFEVLAARRRDWAHWLGIFCVAFALASTYAWNIPPLLGMLATSH